MAFFGSPPARSSGPMFSSPLTPAGPLFGTPPVTSPAPFFGGPIWESGGFFADGAESERKITFTSMTSFRGRELSAGDAGGALRVILDVAGRFDNPAAGQYDSVIDVSGLAADIAVLAITNERFSGTLVGLDDAITLEIVDGAQVTLDNDADLREVVVTAGSTQNGWLDLAAADADALEVTLTGGVQLTDLITSGDTSSLTITSTGTLANHIAGATQIDMVGGTPGTPVTLTVAGDQALTLGQPAARLDLTQGGTLRLEAADGSAFSDTLTTFVTLGNAPVHLPTANAAGANVQGSAYVTTHGGMFNGRLTIALDEATVLGDFALVLSSDLTSAAGQAVHNVELHHFDQADGRHVQVEGEGSGATEVTFRFAPANGETLNPELQNYSDALDTLRLWGDGEGRWQFDDLADTTALAVVHPHPTVGFNLTLAQAQTMSVAGGDAGDLSALQGDVTVQVNKNGTDLTTLALPEDATLLLGEAVTDLRLTPEQFALLALQEEGVDGGNTDVGDILAQLDSLTFDSSTTELIISQEGLEQFSALDSVVIEGPLRVVQITDYTALPAQLVAAGVEADSLTLAPATSEPLSLSLAELQPALSLTYRDDLFDGLGAFTLRDDEATLFDGPNAETLSDDVRLLLEQATTVQVEADAHLSVARANALDSLSGSETIIYPPPLVVSQRPDGIYVTLSEPGTLMLSDTGSLGSFAAGTHQLSEQAQVSRGNLQLVSDASGQTSAPTSQYLVLGTSGSDYISFTAASAEHLVDLGDGNDSFFLNNNAAFDSVNNTFFGGEGVDWIVIYTDGADRYVYTDPTHSNKTQGRDTLYGFTPGQDTLQFSLSGPVVNASEFATINGSYWLKYADEQLPGYAVLDNWTGAFDHQLYVYTQATEWGGNFSEHSDPSVFNVNVWNSEVRARDLEFVITGTNGDDTLIGSIGDDVITGGPGADTLTGGLGQDTFVFAFGNTDGPDVITDFSAGAGGDILAFEGMSPIVANPDEGIVVNGTLSGPLDAPVTILTQVTAASDAVDDIADALAGFSDTREDAAFYLVLDIDQVGDTASSGTAVVFYDNLNVNPALDANELSVVASLQGVKAVDMTADNLADIGA